MTQNKAMKKSIYLTLFALLSFMFFSCKPTNNDDAEMRKIIDHSMSVAKSQSIAMAEVLADSTGKLPRTFENGKLKITDSGWWCSGFFPGVLWYLYEYSPNDTLLNYAKTYTQRVEDQKYTTDNHDVGFMIYCSFGNGYRLTGDTAYPEVMTTAAKSLCTRYNPKVGLIRSWDHNADKWQYPVIIDNMMNLELLLWAAKYTGDSTFYNISIEHADKTMKNHYRSDYSSYHVVSYDTITGNVEKKQTSQGLSDESAWSRGQAWGLYGYTMMYRLTKEPRYLEQANHIAAFILNHPNLPEDKIPYWDFDAPDIPNALRDASAGAIICSALIELSTFVDEPLKKQYIDVARTQLKTLSSPEYLAEPGTNGNFVLKHSVGSLPHKGEVDVPLTYADYYFIEALLRYKNIILN